MKISEAVHDAFWSKVGVKPPTKAIGVDEGLRAAIEQHKRESASVEFYERLSWYCSGIIAGAFVMYFLGGL